MKVILNTNTVFNGIPLSKDTLIDVELRVADRWITRGLAHLPVEVKAIPVKSFDEYVKDTSAKLSEITYEDLGEVTDIDLIEPIPIDRYVSFEEPKISKQIKKKSK